MSAFEKRGNFQTSRQTSSVAVMCLLAALDGQHQIALGYVASKLSGSALFASGYMLAISPELW